VTIKYKQITTLNVYGTTLMKIETGTRILIMFT